MGVAAMPPRAPVKVCELTWRMCRTRALVKVERARRMMGVVKCILEAGWVSMGGVDEELAIGWEVNGAASALKVRRKIRKWNRKKSVA
jgi:hypothetical protein